MRRSTVSLASLVLAGLLAGCEAKIYRAETVLHPDGRVSRAVYQPADETPPDAQTSSAWEKRTYVPRIPHEEWNDTIRSLPEAIRDDDRPYFAAWGDFSSADKLPQTFRKTAPQGKPDGTLQLDYQREDLVLVVEHRWRETLTDIVTLDDMHQARRELADILLPIAEKVLNRGLGDAYDTTEVVSWMRNTVTPIAFDVTDVLFDVGARGQLDRRDQLDAALAPLLARHGIPMGDGSKSIFDTGDEVLANYLRGVFQEKLKRRDGQPVRPAVIDEILQWLGVMPVPDGFEKSQRYEEAAKQVVLETYGSEDGLGLVLQPLLYRILGLYGGDLLAAKRSFVYKLEMPGPIVETSGEMLSERVTRFRFDDGQAYPFGFAMQCRSLVEQGAIEEKLLGHRVLVDRQKLIAYVDLLHGNDELLNSMKNCAAESNLAPLRRQRDQLASEESDRVRVYDALLRLLEANDN